MPGLPPDDDALQRGVWSLRSAIQAVAREAFGAAIVERPIPGLSILDRDVEPVAGVRAAVLARGVAAGQLLYYAERARGGGKSWDDVAGALGVAPDGGGEWSRGELAYLHLVEDRSLHPEDEPGSAWRSRLSWRCVSCGQLVTDRGPFEAAPDNNEAGHAPDCVRHAAEIAAHRAEWGQQ